MSTLPYSCLLYTSIFVHGNGDMVLAGPELLKQLAHDLGLGYKKGRTHDFVHRSMVLGRIDEEADEILGVGDPDDVVARILVDGDVYKRQG